MAKNFLGQDGFIWVTGVVEDRLDPMHSGRVRVRCLGYHTYNKTELPTEDLPWAQVLIPITSSGISGVGQTPLGLVEGAHVVGFFRDGLAAQEPVLLGSMPGFPIETATNPETNTDKGFFDPSGTYPKRLGEPVCNALATNEGLPTSDAPPSPNYISLQLSLRDLESKTNIGIPTADFAGGKTASGSAMAASAGTTWDQPTIPYKAKYPKNHVYETESGHIKEFDDTPDAERIYEFHKAGTSYEIDKDGNKVDLIKKDHYTIESGNDACYIAGNADITIGGRHKVLINMKGEADNHYDIQIGQGANVNVQVNGGDINLNSYSYQLGSDVKGGNINVNCSGDYNLLVGGNYTSSIMGAKTENIGMTKESNTVGSVVHRGGTVVVQGATIDLN